MVLSSDKERVKTLLKDTITLLCRNGLSFKCKFSIEALIGVTLDDDDIFLISINELIKTELGKAKELAEEKAAQKSPQSEDESAEESGSGGDSPSRQHRRRKRKRKSKVKTEPGAGDGSGDDQDNDAADSDEPDTKQVKTRGSDNGLDNDSESITRQRSHPEQTPDYDEDSNEDIVFIKQEMDTWSENAANTSQSQFNFTHGADNTQSDMNFSGLGDMNLVPVTSQDEGNMVWASGIQGQLNRTFPGTGRSSTSMATQQGDGPMMGQPPQQMLQNMLHCEVCGNQFKSLPGWKTHMDAHHGIFKLKCPYCQKGFCNKQALQGHLVLHTGIKEFKCDICGKEYGYKKDYRRHMKEKHNITIAMS